MAEHKKVVVVGGVAAGPKTAAKIRRLDPTAEITIVEKGEFLSYAGCGLPYYISGVVAEQKELMCTPVGVVRDPAFFKNVKDVTVLNKTEATRIDRATKRVEVVGPAGSRWLDYDVLVLATGATPVVPPLEGIDLPNIFALSTVENAEAIKTTLADGKARDVVVVGGGLIGVEMVEALVHRGCRVTIVEMLPQVLPMLDWEIARLVQAHLESKGVRVLVESRVERFEGDGRVERVIAGDHTVPCDMAVLAIGVRPNVTLAKEAGLEIGETGAIKVNERMQTSDPDIYAAGDCVESVNIITGKPCYVPLGSTANKHGRVAATNICGGDESFPGVLGSTVCKVFDFGVARTGLGERQAREAGYDVVTCMAPAPDKAHYYPTAKLLLLKLIADRKSRKLLGIQATGPGDSAKRIDVAAAALTMGMTVDQVANLDLSYAPPFSAAMDNIITAANVIRNKISGHMDGLTPMEVKRKIDAGEDVFLLDVRTPAELEEQGRIEGSVNIPLGMLRRQLDQVPRGREIIAFCKLSLRGYEAALILKANGFDGVKVMDGGILMWPYEKVFT